MLLAVVLLSAWITWFFFAQVTVYEVSGVARLEVSKAAHSVEAQVSGRIRATYLILGQVVQDGDVLVELNADAHRLRLEEEQTRLTALVSKPAMLRDEISAEEAALREDQQAQRIALDQARARYREAEVAAQLGVQENARMARLLARGVVAELDAFRVKVEARKRREAADALRLEISRLEWDLRTRVSDRQVHIQRLMREVTQIEGQIATTHAVIKQLEYEIEQRSIRAPVSGRLGEVAMLQVGAIVRQGDKLGTIVPPGILKVITYFLPPAALGRIQPGQPAQLRLKGFPWTQYGAISATVANVASEVRDGQIRVELAVSPDAVSLIPLQHGLPGTVEVEVERVSPATLVLRTAGLLLTVPETSHNLQVGRRAER
jgi:multidrug resistance efflux pump